LVQSYLRITCRISFGSNKHRHSCVGFVFHNPQCEQRGGHVHYVYVYVGPKTYWKCMGYVIDNCFKTILCCMNKRCFHLKEQYLYFHSNYRIFSNNFPLPCHHVWGQQCSTYQLHGARTTFLWLKLSIKATFFITSALSTTCRQRPGTGFLLPTLRYWPFALWYKEARQRNFASDNCAKNGFCHKYKCISLQCNHLILHATV
jgi:hypothetical protein